MTKLSYFILLLLLVSSCIPNKKLIYLNGKNFAKDVPTAIKNEKNLYKVQTSDILSVIVQSAQPEISSQFNTSPNGNPNSNAGNFIGSPASLFLTGYTVDAQGYINMPTVGKILVKNLTVSAIQELIQSKVNEYLNDATVSVRLVSFKITVLGTVTKPGYYYFYNGQVTLLEALGEAGDLTPLANRKNLKLIRQTSEGSEVVLLDLNDPNLLKSKYYYLLPNDVIYVEPLKAGTQRSNLVPIATAISALVLVLTYIRTTVK